jgi:hypothetical protein
MPQLSIVELAQKLIENVTIVSEFLTTQNLPHPSFSASGPLEFPVPADHVEIHVARHEALEASMMLHNLLLYPRDQSRFLITEVSRPLISMRLARAMVSSAYINVL